MSAEDEAILAAFKAECDKVGVPYDPAGLVRHHRGSAAVAAGAHAYVATHRAERQAAHYLRQLTRAGVLLTRARMALSDEHCG